MQGLFKQASISESARLHESIEIVIHITRAKEQRAYHKDGVTGKILETMYEQLCETQERIILEMSSHSAKDYDEAVEQFNCASTPHMGADLYKLVLGSILNQNDRKSPIRTGLPNGSDPTYLLDPAVV